MNEWLFQLIENNRWLLTLLAVIAIIVVIVLLWILIYSQLKGRSITTPFGKIGPSDEQKSEKGPIQNQTTTINNILPPVSHNLTGGDINEIFDRVTRYFMEAKESGNYKPLALYNPPTLPERIIYIYSLRHYIQYLVSAIVLNWGGPWMGYSLADFSIYLDLATTNKLISDDLLRKIGDFWQYCQPFLNNNDIPDQAFLEIQYFGSEICRQLDYINQTLKPPPGSEGPVWGEKYPSTSN